MWPVTGHFYLALTLISLQVSSMRSIPLRIFFRGYQEALLEGHELAFGLLLRVYSEGWFTTT